MFRSGSKNRIMVENCQNDWRRIFHTNELLIDADSYLGDSSDLFGDELPKDDEEFVNALRQIDGIESFAINKFSVTIFIRKAFDWTNVENEILEAIIKNLEWSSEETDVRHFNSSSEDISGLAAINSKLDFIISTVLMNQAGFDFGEAEGIGTMFAASFMHMPSDEPIEPGSPDEPVDPGMPDKPSAPDEPEKTGEPTPRENVSAPEEPAPSANGSSTEKDSGTTEE